MYRYTDKESSTVGRKAGRGREKGVGGTYQSLGTRVDDRHEHAGHGEPGARIFAVKVAEADDAKALGDDHAEDTDGGLDREDCRSSAF